MAGSVVTEPVAFGAGVTPSVVEADAVGCHFLNSGAALSSSFVVSRETWMSSSLASGRLIVRRSTGIATDFSPMPRNPPTPTTTAAARPFMSNTTSLTSPMSSSAALRTLAPIRLEPRKLVGRLRGDEGLGAHGAGGRSRVGHGRRRRRGLGGTRVHVRAGRRRGPCRNSCPCWPAASGPCPSSCRYRRRSGLSRAGIHVGAVCAVLPPDTVPSVVEAAGGTIS